jgi:uncharacterized protein YdhG (YjbR/CyaY superfamily)
MARYIDADKFIKQFERALEHQQKYGLYNHAKLTEFVIKAIENEPTADVVPKSEVIDEFANRLKERLYAIPTVYNSHFGRMVDDIAKDMKGE